MGIEFSHPHGLLSIKHSNICHVDGGRSRAELLIREVDADDPLRAKGRVDRDLGRAPSFN